jgi:hypothetical protein
MKDSVSPSGNSEITILLTILLKCLNLFPSRLLTKKKNTAPITLTVATKEIKLQLLFNTEPLNQSRDTKLAYSLKLTVAQNIVLVTSLSDLVCTVIWTMSAGRQVKP